MEEYLDVYDDNLRPAGALPRSVVHREGWWHHTFHCWLQHRDAGGELLIFQRRSLRKDTNPGKLDVTCAGHLSAGERLADAVRELEEELGLAVAFEELTEVGTVRHEHREAGIVDREVCHVFWLDRSVPLSGLRPDPQEVEALVLVGRRDFLDLVAGRRPFVRLRRILRSGTGTWAETDEEVSLADFVARPSAYYEQVFGLPPIPSGRKGSEVSQCR